MSKGYALNIGLNYVDASQYRGWSGYLHNCVNDAEAMNDIAQERQFTHSILLNEQATQHSVITHLNDFAQKLERDDFFLLSYSGHGGRRKDKDGDETDGWDEAWCLYDDILLDDQLNDSLRKFRSGVRIFVVSDSCYSGSMTRDLFGKSKEFFHGHRGTRDANSLFTAKNLSDQGAIRANHMTAHVRLFSGSREDQLSRESDGHGKFTKAFLNVWNHGDFKGNYHDFFRQIVEKMSFSQLPQHALLDPVSFQYDSQSPFEI